MIESVYEYLAKFGYTHPIHPPMTHLPLGLIIGAFIFIIFGWLFRGSSLGQTARHCIILAFIGAFPTILAGILDWQHRFGGAFLFPIKMKLILAGTLIFLAAFAVGRSRRAKAVTLGLVAVYALCLVNVIALGYFGGELVYGKKQPAVSKTDDPAVQGAEIFAQSCSACHYADSTDTSVGPGLKGIFKRGAFPVSGWTANEESFRRQLKTPYAKMPLFADLTDDKINELIAYLNTL